MHKTRESLDAQQEALQELSIEYCVLCGASTEYKRNDNINIRKWYVEGAGQLCEECYNRLYNNREK